MGYSTNGSVRVQSCTPSGTAFPCMDIIYHGLCFDVTRTIVQHRCISHWQRQLVRNCISLPNLRSMSARSLLHPATASIKSNNLGLASASPLRTDGLRRTPGHKVARVRVKGSNMFKPYRAIHPNASKSSGSL